MTDLSKRPGKEAQKPLEAAKYPIKFLDFARLSTKSCNLDEIPAIVTTSLLIIEKLSISKRVLLLLA